jgi:hypothetical protein
MVNIQSIVVLSRNNVLTFNSTQENWAFIMSKANNPARLQKQLRNKKLAQMLDQLISLRYGVPKEKVKHVLLIFGNIKETLKQLRSENTRLLLFDTDNRVTITIIDKPPVYQTITIIYTKEGNEQIVSTLHTAASLQPTWEL